MDILYLGHSEFPKSELTQLLANKLPEWMHARANSLPDTITSTSSGDPFQKFVNASALVLDDLDVKWKSQFKGLFLNYPANTVTSLCSAMYIDIEGDFEDYDDLFADGAPYYITGTVINPDRIPRHRIRWVSNLHDFYYGYTDVLTYESTATDTVEIPYLADEIHYVKINGAETSAYIIDNAHTRSTEDMPTLSTLIRFDETASGTVSVKYTTNDVCYDEGISRIFFRNEYDEIFYGTTVANSQVYRPVLTNLANELDELGLYYDLPRFLKESNSDYKKRIQNASIYPEDATQRGMLNSCSNRLGLIQCTTIPGSADTATISGSAYEDSIRIDMKKIDYYSWSAPYDITGIYTYGNSNTINWVLPVTAGDMSLKRQFTIRYEGVDSLSLGDLVPTVVTTEPTTAFLFEDEMEITSDKQFLFNTELEFASGSLVLYHNGSRKTAGVDFVEIGRSGFEVNFAVDKDEDTMIVSYIPYSDGIPEGKLLSVKERSYIEDIAILAMGMSAKNITKVADGTVSPSIVESDDEIEYTVTFANYGNVDIDSVAISLTLPPRFSVSSSGGITTVSKLTEHVNDIDLRHYAESDISIKSLWGDDVQSDLLESDGTASAEMKAYAGALKDLAPIVWGDAVWDLSSWFSKETWSTNDWHQNFSFIPNVFDPDLSEYELTGVYVPAFSKTTISPITIISPELIFGGSRYALITTYRRRDFRSGILYGGNLKAYLDLEDGNFASRSVWSIMPRYPVEMDRGFYFYNDVGSYLFAEKGIETFANVASAVVDDNVISANNPVIVTVKAATGIADFGTKLRRTFFADGDLRPTHTFTETVTGNGADNRLYLSYANVENVAVTPTVTFSVSGESNVIELDEETIVSPSSAFTVTYSLSGSYYVDWGYSAAEVAIVATGAYPYMVVEYETADSSSDRHVSNQFVNPMWNPISRGFIYLTDWYYQVGHIDVWATPQYVMAGSNQPILVTAEVLDAYGSPIPNAIVSIVTSTGHNASLSTDRFGRVRRYIPTPASPQILRIDASVDVYNESIENILTLGSTTNVDVFDSLFNPVASGPFYAPDGDIDQEDIDDGTYAYYS